MASDTAMPSDTAMASDTAMSSDTAMASGGRDSQFHYTHVYDEFGSDETAHARSDDPTPYPPILY